MVGKFQASAAEDSTPQNHEQAHARTRTHVMSRAGQASSCTQSVDIHLPRSCFRLERDVTYFEIGGAGFFFKVPFTFLFFEGLQPSTLPQTTTAERV